MSEHLPEDLRCSCSVMGFADPLWAADYYPAECPEDWHVAYFGNDFRSVYLCADEWAGNTALMASIAEEMEPGFDLVLQWPAGLDAAQSVAQLCELEPLQQLIACVVLNANGGKLSALREIIQILNPHFVLNLDFPLNVKPQDKACFVALAAEFALGRVWYPQNSDAPFQACAYQVVKLACTDLREMTAVLQQLDKMLTESQRCGVFLQPAAQSPQRALELRTVIELMEI